MQRVSYDLITSLLLIAVASLALWETNGLSEMSYVFPRAVGIVFLTLSIVYFISSLIKSTDKKIFADINKKKALFMCLGMVGYAVLIALVGFLISSIVYISCFTWYLQIDVEGKTNKLKWIHSGISGAGVSLFFFGLFRYVFLVPLPSGVLFG
jgi:hypothetical protein